MNTNTVKEIKSIDFEVERTPVKLGKSNRVFYMDFGDLNFPNRLSKALKDIDRIVKKKNNRITQNGKNEMFSIIQETDSDIKNALNQAFGYDVSKDVFGIVSTLSVTKNGELYYENFINALLPLVEREYDVRVKKISDRAQKYTANKGQYLNPRIIK